MHGAIVRWFAVPDNPARGKAQGRIVARGQTCGQGNGPQTGAEAQKSTPTHPRPIAFADRVNSNRRSVTPTKINRGGSGGMNGTWARTGRNVEATRAQRCDRGAK